MPIKIYRLSDRIRIAIGEVTFIISPLSYHQKTEIVGCLSRSSGTQIENTAQMAFLALKYSLKGIEGLIDANGNNYELEFDQDGTLTDNCVSEIFQIEYKEKLIQAIGAMINKIDDPGIEGVSIILPTESLPIKKKT